MTEVNDWPFNQIDDSDLASPEAVGMIGGFNGLIADLEANPFDRLRIEEFLRHAGQFEKAVGNLNGHYVGNDTVAPLSTLVQEQIDVAKGRLAVLVQQDNQRDPSES